MTKYIVKDKDWSDYWTCDIHTYRKEDAYIFSADELKSNKYIAKRLLNKKRYVLIPVKE